MREQKRIIKDESEMFGVRIRRYAFVDRLELYAAEC